MLERHLLRAHNKGLMITEANNKIFTVLTLKLMDIYGQDFHSIKWYSSERDLQDRHCFQDLNKNIKCLLVQFTERSFALDLDYWINFVSEGIAFDRKYESRFTIYPKIVLVTSLYNSDPDINKPRLDQGFDKMPISDLMGIL